MAADLAARAHPFHVAIENFGHDHNIGTVVRTANAFGAAGVHIVGRRRWNRRGAMVTDRYLAVHHHDDVAALADFARDHGLAVVAVDNTPGAQRLETAQLPRACLLLFGQEGPGVTDAARAAAADDRVDRPVRLDPLHQRGRGGRDRDARLGAPARRPLPRLVATRDAGGHEQNGHGSSSPGTVASSPSGTTSSARTGGPPGAR